MLPLVTLEDQVEGEMARLGLPYVNVTSTPLEALEEQIQNTQPYVLLGNVESLNSADVQRKISKLKISYIAIDEAQVSSSFSLAQIQIQRQRQSGIFLWDHFIGRWPTLWAAGPSSGPTLQIFGAGYAQLTRASRLC